MDDLFRNRFAERVRNLRGRRSQGEFAHVLGVSQPTITGWEKCSNLPNLENLEKLAQLAGELPEYFLASLYGRNEIQNPFLSVSAMQDSEIGGLLRQISNRFLNAA